jgi:hypothetical protein
MTPHPSQHCPTESKDAFVSYSHADADWVWKWLRPRLEEAGLRLCLDRRDFDVGVPSLENRLYQGLECIMRHDQSSSVGGAYAKL